MGITDAKIGRDAEIGSHAEAAEALRWSAVRSPGHWVTQLKLGQALALAGDHEQAVLALSCAQILNPNAPAPLIGRAQAYEALHLIGRAIKDVEAALQMEPNSGKFKRLRDRLVQQADAAPA